MLIPIIIWSTCFLAGLVIGGIVLGKIYNKTDDALDDIQWALNDLENRVAAAGAPEFAKVLGAAVVGDADRAMEIYNDLRLSDNTTKKWQEMLLIPCFKTIWNESRDDPELRTKLVKYMGVEELKKEVAKKKVQEVVSE